jgi:putative tricarboxylic transport membrane protein
MEIMMIKSLLGTATLVCVGFGVFAPQIAQAEPRRPECIAPSKPGGGFDLTCKVLQMGLKDTELLKRPMRITYMPGGVGAVAFNTVNAHRRAEPGTVVAFGSGSLLNLQQGRFGRYSMQDARWLATLGVDYGALAIRSDGKYKSLDAVIEALKADPGSVVFGISGSPGNPHWMKVALLAKQAGVDVRKMRFVSFEGNGDAMTNMLGGHFDVLSSDVSALVSYLDDDNVQVLSVFSKDRLPGRYAELPTAKEQGHDVEWQVLRGVYMGPDVSDADYEWWQNIIQDYYKTDRYVALREQFGLFPMELSGSELQETLERQSRQFMELSEEFGFIEAN